MAALKTQQHDGDVTAFIHAFADSEQKCRNHFETERRHHPRREL